MCIYPYIRSGILQIGDRILAINEYCLDSISAEDANQFIRQSIGPLTLTVEFDVMGAHIYLLLFVYMFECEIIAVRNCSTEQRHVHCKIGQTRSESWDRYKNQWY